MGYRIEYVTEDRGGARNGRRSNVSVLTLLVFCAFLTGVRLWWPEGWETLWDLLIPGDRAQAAQSLEQMVLSLRQGVEFRDAVTAFCGEILAGG